MFQCSRISESNFMEGVEPPSSATIRLKSSVPIALSTDVSQHQCTDIAPHPNLPSG